MGLTCSKCFYHRIYSACLYYLPNTKQYWTRYFNHLDTRFATFDIDKKRGDINDPGKSERVLLHKHECPTVEEASVWTSGYFLYTKIDASLKGTTVSFLNAAIPFRWGAWKVVNHLALARDFRIVPTTEKLGTPPSNYVLYFDSKQNATPGSQEFQDVVYKVKVDELTYIGQTAVVGTRRKRKIADHDENEKTSIAIIFQRLKEKAIDPISLESYSTIIGEITDIKTSGCMVESMALLTYCAKWDLLRSYDNKIVNKLLSFTLLPTQWFEEIQHHLAVLTGGSTIKIELGKTFDKDQELFPVSSQNN